MKNLFKYASLLAAAAMLFACEGNVDPEQGEGTGGDPVDPNLALVVTPDKTIVQTFGGDYITFTVTLGEEVITEGVTFYEGNTPVALDGMKYSTTVAGEHVLKANYGTYISEEVTLRAFSVEIPDTPEDPQPNSTDFKARVLVVEHTGTKCGYCPPMKTILHKAMEDEEFADKVVLTSCHTYNTDDPAHFNENEFKDFNGVSGHPYVYCDSYASFKNYNLPVSSFVSIVEELYNAKKDVAAGIAVNSVLSGDDVVISVEVKSAETAHYSVGAYLLEDGIEGTQTNATENWMNVHDGVISNVDAKSSGKYYGYPLGEIAKGETSTYVFVWNLDEIQTKRQRNSSGRNAFVKNNLNIAVFVTTEGTNDKGKFEYVNNVVECSINGQTPYEYR